VPSLTVEMMLTNSKAVFSGSHQWNGSFHCEAVAVVMTVSATGSLSKNLHNVFTPCKHFPFICTCLYDYV
jgi:hypothetical protein